MICVGGDRTIFVVRWLRVMPRLLIVDACRDQDYEEKEVPAMQVTHGDGGDDAKEQARATRV